jgi:hypothetical protein
MMRSTMYYKFFGWNRCRRLTFLNMRQFHNRAKEKWAFLRRTGTANNRLAIFVHGFRGNYLRTWGALPEFLEQHADSDSILSTWDYVFIGYETGHVKTYLDISSLICGESRRAVAGEPPYNQNYQKLALFGHSLGTLGIRQALCANATHGGGGILQRLHSVTLFGSPLNGSKLAFLGSLFYPIAEALRPENVQLRMLKVWCEGSFTLLPWPKVRVVLGQGDWVVGQQFAELVQWPGDLYPPEQTVLDHSDLVKPEDWKHSSVMDYVRSALR